MYFQSLFTRAADKPVRVCLMGAGEFGASYIFQAREMPHMEVPAACTRTVQRAVDAFRAAGIPDSKIRVCDSSEEAKKAYADGFFVVADSFEKLADLPLEVLVESSGAPGSGAMAADLAISKGMHVVMVSKEVDSIVGPLMGHKARQKGLVYTTGDGDQPSLLIGLISWARALGLNIVGAGKASEYDFVYDPTVGRLTCSGQKQSFPCSGLEGQWVFGDRPAQDVINARAAMMGSLVMRSMPDLCEMTVVANATGIKPDTPSFHAPVARIPEIPELFRPKSDGGLFDSPGRLDIFNCLRRPDEVSMAGGEFIVVECKDKKLWKILEAKGHPVSRNGRHAALYLPQHLLGVETGTSVLAAAIMGHATGGDNLRPVCDMHGRALRDLKKGHLFDLGGHHHVIDGVDGFINDASPVVPENPLPFYMIGNLELKRDVPAGKVICLNDVVLAEDSPLLRLRREQDRVFGLIR